MDLTDSHYAQLVIALFLGLILFVVAYIASEKYVVYLLVATLPFQAITSVYGTLNTVLIYMVGIIFLLRGRLKKLPMLWSAVLIIFALLLSTSQAHQATYPDHFFYLVTIAANFVLFYIVYNYFIQKQIKPTSAIYLFLFSGFLVLLFSFTKLVFNFDPGLTFGISELDVIQERKNQRFFGFFNAVGVNGAFHATQLLIVAFMFMFDRRVWVRSLLVILFIGNAAFLFATGSRGAFLAGAGGFLLLLILFARQIGLGRVAMIGVSGILLFGGAVAVIAKYSDYDVLFERLAGTTFTENYMPDTRDWSHVLDRIPEKIILGHGPRLRLINEQLRRIPGYEPLGYYPHNLYLHLIYTTGVVGLLAYLTWFLALIARYMRPFKYKSDSPLLTAVPRLALLLTIVFLVDELKIEFLRFSLSDYQQCMFALWAMLLALSDRAYNEGHHNATLYKLEVTRQRQAQFQA